MACSASSFDAPSGAVATTRLSVSSVLATARSRSIVVTENTRLCCISGIST
jgi:hypothetical protein